MESIIVNMERLNQILEMIESDGCYGACEYCPCEEKGCAANCGQTILAYLQ